MKKRFTEVAGVLVVVLMTGASCSSSGDVVLPVLPSAQNQIDAATTPGDAVFPVLPSGENQIDAATTPGDAALTLGVVDYVALVSVRSTADEKGLPQTGSVIVTIEDVHWITDGTWNLGVYQKFDGPSPGASVDLIVYDEWAVESGDKVVIAVSTLTRPRPDADGFVQLVLDENGAMFGERSRVAGAAISELVELGRTRRSASDLEITVEMIKDAHVWVGELNQRLDGTARPRPGGLLGSLTGGLGEDD